MCVCVLNNGDDLHLSSEDFLHGSQNPKKTKDFKTLNICLLFFGEKFKKKKKREEDPLYRKHPRRDGETPFARWNVDVDDDKEEEEEEEEEETISFFLSFFRDDVNDRG